MMELSSLTVVLPAFNEERIIEKAIISAQKIAAQLARDYEIIVVDDGSQDRTKEIIKQLTSADSYIKGVFLTKHTGYGKALSTGFYNAQKEFIFYTDSDLPIDITKELPKAISLIRDDIDAVIGYRINPCYSLLRRLYALIYNSMNRVLFGIKIKDVNFSCKLFRKKIFDKIILNSHSVFIDGELLANLNRYGFKIKEFPATYVPREYGASNFDSIIYSLCVFVEMLMFWIRNYLIYNNYRKR